MKSNNSTAKKAFVASIPVLSGYLVLGMGFGILLRAAGYGCGWAFVMSVLIYAGSLQYVGVSLLASGASLITVALTSLMVQARHLFYGISLVEKYAGAGKKKLYMIFGLTDETYSLVCADTDMETEEYHRYCFLLTLFDHSYWICGGILGNLLGSALPFDTTGIDFVLTALFITVFVQQWLDNEDHRPALIGVGSTLLAILLFGRESFLIPAMILIAASLLLLQKFPAKGGAK